jgi:hypothetical protein
MIAQKEGKAYREGNVKLLRLAYEVEEYASNGFHGLLPCECPVNHDISQADFFRQRHLTLNSPNRFCARKSVSFLEASHLGLAISRHDDGCIHSCVDAGFKQERHVVNHHGLWICSSGLFRQSSLFASDAGVDDAFELPAFFRIAEDDASEGLAVERAVGIQDSLTECFDNLSPGRFAGFNDFMSQFVGIDDDRAALLEHRGDGAFAGGDASCESDQNHGGGA